MTTRPDAINIAPDTPAPEYLCDATAWAVTIVGEPVVILAPHWTLTAIGQDGSLATADAFETAVRGAGAQPLTDLSFAGTPVSGWLVTIHPDSRAEITGPGVVGEIYNGSLPASAQWLEQVHERQGRGLVVVTVAAPPEIDPP